MPKVRDNPAAHQPAPSVQFSVLRAEVETRAFSQNPQKVEIAILALLAKNGQILATFGNTICR